LFPIRIKHTSIPLALRFAAALLLLTLLPAGVLAQANKLSPIGALPQDTGAAGLKQTLRRLQTTARLLQIDAHPDDEDGGMLTYESRGKGVSVTLLTLNRGEGGQNKVGSNLFDVLGVLRTLEVLAADRYYGVDQRFSRVADFGYSKSAEETFQKWGGHDIAMADIVRVIRAFRPDVIVARFSGTERDGHGHHQVSAILSREAFRAAADPKRFPEQIKEGLHPWQAKKFYIGNVCGFGATTCAEENYTVRLNTGTHDPVLGVSYAQFAMEGLKHQLSQGAGGWSVDPGDRFAFYKLADSVLPPTTDKAGHEKDFFDGIDTSLPGLAARLGVEEKKAPWLRPKLLAMQKEIEKATANDEPGYSAEGLLSGLENVKELIRLTTFSVLSETAKKELLVELTTKQRQFEEAASMAIDARLLVTVETPSGDPDFVGVPGQTLKVSATYTSYMASDVKEIELDLPPGWRSKVVDTMASAPGTLSKITFQVTLPATAELTRPYWHRDNPETDSIYVVDDPRYVTLPFPPPPLRAHAVYAVNGEEGTVRAVGMVDQAGNRERPLAVGPAFSVMLEPGEQIIPVRSGSVTTVRVEVMTNLDGASQGSLRLAVPDGWRVEPSHKNIEFHKREETQSVEFKVVPESLKRGRAKIRAVLESEGKKYTEGYSLVTREDLGSAYYYQPATQRISIVDVKVPKDLKVAYVMGAGDSIPTVLQQIGMNVTTLPAEKLASEDLSKYGTIVLGIRAYDTQKDVATNNKKLLDYVSNGGTLVVQYNAATGDFNSGHFTPYPAQLTRTRVSVEEAPVDMLAPDDGIFHSPNQITQKDFDGWVQERGLYFMDSWDSHFTPLLASHDPGEAPQKGGMLRAQYGKGTYIYTGYAFFRQLPAGVPGAIRLYVNLLSAGHEVGSGR
jgi:LmbE family N-acetylglucosaminyl deacetylase